MVFVCLLFLFFFSFFGCLGRQKRFLFRYEVPGSIWRLKGKKKKKKNWMITTSCHGVGLYVHIVISSCCRDEKEEESEEEKEDGKSGEE